MAMSKIFVSYRRGDNPDGVKLVYERLRKLLPGWKVFYDHHSIDLGSEFPERLQQAVTDAEFVLVVKIPRLGRRPRLSEFRSQRQRPVRRTRTR